MTAFGIAERSASDTALTSSRAPICTCVLLAAIHQLGTHLAGVSLSLKDTVDRQIALECCLTSNEQTKAVAKVAEHPLRQLIEAGVLCTLCTDNRTVSNVTLSGEYHLAQRTFGLSVAEIVMLLDNAFRSGFIQYSTRARIRIEAMQRTLEILRDNGIPIDSLYKHPYSPLLNHTARLEKRQFYWVRLRREEGKNRIASHLI